MDKRALGQIILGLSILCDKNITVKKSEIIRAIETKSLLTYLNDLCKENDCEYLSGLIPVKGKAYAYADFMEEYESAMKRQLETFGTEPFENGLSFVCYTTATFIKDSF